MMMVALVAFIAVVLFTYFQLARLLINALFTCRYDANGAGQKLCGARSGADGGY